MQAKGNRLHRDAQGGLMAKFRKKPVVIEAWRVGSFDPRPDWAVFAYGNGVEYAIIRTLEGDMRAERGDWIIRGVKGEIYPCKPDIFAATYDAVEGD
jgi:hypothetical protein